MNQAHPMNNTIYDTNEAYATHDVNPTRRRRSQPSLETRPYPSRPTPPSSHCMNDEGHSPNYVTVKVEPRGDSIFPEYSFLPAMESPQSSPSSNPAYFPHPTMSYEHSSACMIRPANYGVATQMAAALERYRYDDEDHFIVTHRVSTQSGLVTIAPDNTQLPSAEDFGLILDQYIKDLSPKKQDKALIPSKRLTNIEAVLRDPKCTTIESAQFRFWAKKMFKLGFNEKNGRECVMHEDKPVAVREKLYQVLTTAHFEAQHGGRDKTSAQVRAGYSWVPKELIARFVRACPNCRARRSPPHSRGCTNKFHHSPPRAAAQAMNHNRLPYNIQIPAQHAMHNNPTYPYPYSEPVSVQHAGAPQYSTWAPQ